MTTFTAKDASGSTIYFEALGAGTVGDPFRSFAVDDGPAEAGALTYTTSADMTTAADIGPAPSGGEKSVLLQAVISADAEGYITLQSETTPGAERHTFYMPKNSAVVFIPRYPIKLPIADKKWQAIAEVACNVAFHTVTKSEA
jgi:hypothetical protein